MGDASDERSNSRAGQTAGMPELGGTRRDTVAAAVRGIVGMIPGAGSLIAEIVTHVIPCQRTERIEAFVRLLDERMAAVEREDLKRRLHEPENIDLFEDGATQAVRAVSEDRKHYIAALVANGISGDEAARLQSKRLLNLLREIDDRQIIMLTSYLHRYQRDDDFFTKHEGILFARHSNFGSHRADLDRQALHDDARGHLLRLSLLTPRFKHPKKGEAPEFDQKTGTLKINRYDLTPLGRLLLRQVGIAQMDEL